MTGRRFCILQTYSRINDLMLNDTTDNMQFTGSVFLASMPRSGSKLLRDLHGETVIVSTNKNKNKLLLPTK